MRASYSFLMILGIAAAVAGETSMAHAQSSPAETPAIRKLREDLGLEPRSDIQQDGIGQIDVSPLAKAPEVPVIEPRTMPVPAPAAKALTADDFKRPVAFENDLFSIAFPGKHQTSEDKERHAREYHYSPDTNKTKFHVEVLDLPAEINDSNAQQLFTLFRDQLLKSPPSRVLSERNRPQSWHPGREIVLQLTAPGQTDMLNLRLVFAAHRLYVVSVKHSAEMAPAVPAAFLDSFRIAKASRLTHRHGLVPSPAPAPNPTPAPMLAPTPAPSPAPVSLTADDFKHPVAFANDNFTIAFPGEYRSTEDKDQHLRQYNCAIGGMKFGISVQDASSDINDSNVVAQFNTSRDSFLKAGPARLISERDCPQGGHPGREFNFQWTKGRSRFLSMRLFLAAHRIYAVCVGHDTNPPTAAVAAFLDSFQVGVAGQATNPSALAPLPAPAPAAVSLTADDFKHPVTIANDNFAIAFPGKYRFQETNEHHSRKYNCVVIEGSLEFAVSVVDLPSHVGDSNIAFAFNGLRDNVIKAGPARLISERDRPQASHPGREFNFQSTGAKAGYVAMRLVFADHRLYAVCVGYTGNLAPAAIAAFLDSFRLDVASQSTNPPAVAPVLAPAPTPASAAVTANDFKHPTVFTADKFIVAFPGKYERSETQKHTRMYSYRSADGKIELGVTVLDLPATGDDSIAPKLFDATRDTILQEMHARLVSEQNRPQNGHPGRELKLQLAAQNQSAGVRMVVAEHRIYLITASHTADVNPSVAAAFLDSFQAAQTVDSKQMAEEFNKLFK